MTRFVCWHIPKNKDHSRDSETFELTTGEPTSPVVSKATRTTTTSNYLFAPLVACSAHQRRRDRLCDDRSVWCPPQAMNNEAKIIYLPTPKAETIDQREYWWQELEKAERRAEDIRRILGILAVERGLDDSHGGGDAA